MDALPRAGVAVLLFLVSTGGFVGFESGGAVGAYYQLNGASVVGLLVGAAVMMLVVLRYYEGYSSVSAAPPRYDCVELSDQDLDQITVAPDSEVTTAELNYTMVHEGEWKSRQQTRMSTCPPIGKSPTPLHLLMWLMWSVGSARCVRASVPTCDGVVGPYAR
jgi:hypothetical protein